MKPNTEKTSVITRIRHVTRVTRIKGGLSKSDKKVAFLPISQ